MPVIVWWLVAGGAATLMAGLGVKEAGEGVDEAGNGSLKIAGAVLLGTAAVIAYKKVK